MRKGGSNSTFHLVGVTTFLDEEGSAHSDPYKRGSGTQKSSAGEKKGHVDFLLAGSQRVKGKISRWQGRRYCHRMTNHKDWQLGVSSSGIAERRGGEEKEE